MIPSFWLNSVSWVTFGNFQIYKRLIMMCVCVFISFHYFSYFYRIHFKVSYLTISISQYNILFSIVYSASVTFKTRKHFILSTKIAIYFFLWIPFAYLLCTLNLAQYLLYLVHILNNYISSLTLIFFLNRKNKRSLKRDRW